MDPEASESIGKLIDEITTAKQKDGRIIQKVIYYLNVL